MVWVGADAVVRIDAELDAKPALKPVEFPDGGSVTEVYTNPNPLSYVELETLGPLATLNVGDRIKRTVAYTLTPRSAVTPAHEARKALGLL